MRILLAVLILGGGAAVEGWILYRRRQTGELWAMLTLTAAALAAFVVYQLRPELLQYPMFLMRRVFTPIGDWIVGR